MSITVYSKPSCYQCEATYKKLDKNGTEYAIVDITQDPDAFSMVQSLGYQQAPVVIAGDEHWSGYRPDKLNALSNL